MSAAFLFRMTLFTFLIFPTNQGRCQYDTSRSPGRYRQFVPTVFYNSFSLNNAVAFRLQSGDTISTETIDASGIDKHDQKRQRGGNPLTGPFIIENAEAGDVLAVTLTKISLNRPWAFTSETFASRSLPKSTIKELPKPRIVKWKLDLHKNVATTNDSAYPRLEKFSIPTHPFLGCIGVAPNNRKNEILSFFQGPFGGNLDYKGNQQSATIYLPVFHKGAYLYIGDGHAVQGDGEIAGNALETSLDVEFTVRLIKSEILKLSYPRIENGEYIMAVGSAKSIDDALKIATEGLLAWIENDFHLSRAEAGQVMSTGIQYDIAEIADPEVVVVAKMKKQLLEPLRK